MIRRPPRSTLFPCATLVRSATPIVEIARVPITIGGLARHNVANALAAAGASRGLGATVDQVRDGLVDFRPSADRSPGRLDRKSTRLNSSHANISYAVFCLQK